MKGFWEKVDKKPGGCWVWTASTDLDGYGQYNMKAHRFAFTLLRGREPAPVLRHTCENHSCVNPAHLEEASHRRRR